MGKNKKSKSNGVVETIVETQVIENASKKQAKKGNYIYAEGLKDLEHSIIIDATKFEKSKVGKAEKFNALNFLRLAIQEATGTSLTAILESYQETHKSELADYALNKGASISVKKQLVAEKKELVTENEALRNALIAKGLTAEEISALIKG